MDPCARLADRSAGPSAGSGITTVKRLSFILASVLVALVTSTAIAGLLWWRGIVQLPFGPDHRELTMQLRDRGTVVVAGGVPFGLDRAGTRLVDYSTLPSLASALHGRDGATLVRAIRAARADGLLVRTDRALGPAGSLLRAMSEMRGVTDVVATFLSATAALYEIRERIRIEPDDGRRLIAVVRVILQGASPPADRLFPDAIRRPQPTEVAVIVRDGHEPVLWRAVRGGSISRALVDASYAVLDRWNTRQQQRYGPMREAIARLGVTLAVFHGRGTLASRTTEFLDRAVARNVFSIGYEQLGRWEYVLPPTPWAPIPRPATAIADLAREHDVPRPGYLRPELVLYRFRALQLIEREADGPVDVVDPG